MDDRIEALERLSRLHASGQLSDAEFAAAKAKLIDRPRMPPWWVWAIGAALIVVVAFAGWALSPVPEYGNSAETPMPHATEAATENFSDYAMPTAIPTPSSTPTIGATPTPTAPAMSGWVGDYAGRFDGGEGSLTIAPRTGGQLSARLEVAAPGCVGEFSGATADTPDNRLVLTGRLDESDDEECRITLDRSGARVNVDESGCQTFHGAACAFSGSVTRR